MHNADAIEAINFDQLATATDRLLVRSRRASKRWAGEPPRTVQPGIAYADTVPARVSYAQPVPATRIAPSTQFRRLGRLVQSDLERTIIVRQTEASPTQVFAITVVIPTLVGIAIGLATML